MDTGTVSGFPSFLLPSRTGGAPVEVRLIAQLGAGAGDALCAQAGARQRRHAGFVDALDEPTVRLGDMHADAGDHSALHAFAVDRGGHPFHRHRGRRVFTAVSGSGGALLRFASVDDACLRQAPGAFANALTQVEIPPDALFCVRFGGDVWHQFAPARVDSRHPALFALSVHPDELDGLDDPRLHAHVATGDARIPDLTELLPASVRTWLEAHPAALAAIPTTRLALDARETAWGRRVRDVWRRAMGRYRCGAQARAGGRDGVAAGPGDRLHRATTLPADSLLATALPRHHHQDRVELPLPLAAPHAHAPPGAETLLARVLAGFVESPPRGVSRLMRARNLLVRPLRLRTSPLGCPVSSLLGTGEVERFAGRFPVLAQRAAADGRYAEVLLGADDRHLAFRCSIDVRIDPGGHVRVGMANRVQCTNAFGHAYLAAIAGVHQHYIVPAMLRHAVGAAMRDLPQPARVPVSPSAVTPA